MQGKEIGKGKAVRSTEGTQGRGVATEGPRKPRRALAFKGFLSLTLAQIPVCRARRRRLALNFFSGKTSGFPS